MLAQIQRAVIFAVIALAFTFGVAYAGTGVSQLFFQHQADGSIGANGSTLIGQNWADAPCPGHPLGSCVFHGRPDDTGPYAAVACAANATNCTPANGGDNPLMACQGKTCFSGESAATNYGPRSKLLLNATLQMVAYWKGLGVDDPTPDLVTTSGSGYDADITPQDATVQIPMVSKATGIAPSTLATLIKNQTHSAQLGFLGSNYIVVLQLNEALAKLH
jgi:potassium-transporting ATPase KdpC subunit